MSDPLLDEFLAEVNDKYYPQVMEGIDLMDQGQVNEGIEILARPLHTIKGVTGFLDGFLEASTFTHKVESFLKKLQSGEVEPNPESASAGIKAVNMVFSVIDQIRDDGAPNEQETGDLLALLDKVSGGGPKEVKAVEGGVDVEEKSGVSVVRPAMPRIHLSAQKKPLLDSLTMAGGKGNVLLEMDKVLSMGSGAWEEIVQLADIFDLSVSGLRPALKETFYAWGFDGALAAYPDEDTFFAILAQKAGA